MPDQKIILTVLGSAGGVAKAILSVLEKSSQDAHDPIHSFIRSCRLHLVDQKQKADAYYQSLLPRLFPQTTLHQFDLNESGKFRDHLLRTKTTHVIDVSWADTVQMLDCCSELGVKYINTALENTMVDENERLAKLLAAGALPYFRREPGTDRRTEVDGHHRLRHESGRRAVDGAGFDEEASGRAASCLLYRGA